MGPARGGLVDRRRPAALRRAHPSTCRPGTPLVSRDRPEPTTSGSSACNEAMVPTNCAGQTLAGRRTAEALTERRIGTSPPMARPSRYSSSWNGTPMTARSS